VSAWTTTGDSQAPTRSRFVILALLFFTVVINYLDRSNLSVAAPQLGKDLGIDTVRMGVVFSAFGWSYAFCQIPGGWLADRANPRTMYAVLIALWSVATATLGLAGSITVLIALRVLVGALESPSFPINNRVVTTWFPERERATAIGCYTAGEFVGLAFLTPVLMYLQFHSSWRMVFLALGGLGILWSLVWRLIYRGPMSFKGTNAAEIDLIRQGGGLVDLEHTTASPKPALNVADLGKVLSRSKLWGLYIGQYALTSTVWFFLTWFPTYLVQYRGVSFDKAGMLSALPFLAAFCGVVSSGLASDLLLRKGVPIGVARKAPIVAGLLLSTTIIGANFVQTPGYMIAFMATAFFGNGMASISWSLVSAIAPKHLIGLTGGVFNLFGNLSGITVPIIIGFLARGGNFAPALTYVSVMAVIGILCYVFVVGKIERLEE
jgi:MFS transporter, ACS family, D-galactonate transporter